MDELTEDEFDLLDELYFVQHFSNIKEQLQWQDEQLAATLRLLIDKGFVKPLVNHDTEYTDLSKLEKTGEIWHKLYFLATKKGLMVHNGF